VTQNTNDEKHITSYNKSEVSTGAILDPRIIGTWARDDMLGNSDIALQTKFIIELSENGNYKIIGGKN